MPKVFVICLCLIFLSIASNLKAQDANYWSASYNPAGFFTPGATIAFNRDSGVMFFNPALLAYNNKSTASINGSIYQYGRIKIQNGAGPGLDLKSSTASIIPQMVSAIVSLKGEHPVTFGYALIHNPVINYEATQQFDGKINALDDSYSPGKEYFLGQFKNQNVVNQTDGIISAGFKASDHFAIGFSADGQIRSQNYDYDQSSKAIYNTNSSLFPPFANTEESYLINYYNVGITFKGGASYDAGNNHLGLLLTAPMIHIIGRGSLLSNSETNDLITVSKAGNDTTNLLANSRQHGLKATYKMPFSTAFAYAYDYGAGQISFTTEYFAKVNDYNIVTPKNDAFVKGDLDDGSSTPDLLKFKDARRSIINFGIGLSYLLKPELTGFLSLHTDFNNADYSLYKDDNGFKPNISYYNVYHCQVGANIKKRKFNFRAGLLLAYGTTNKYMQEVNYSNANESNFLYGDTVNTNASQFSVGLLLSYMHNF